MLHDEAVKKIERCTKKDDSVPSSTNESMI
jgi:hypothetical protein